MKRRALVIGGYNTATDGLFTTTKLHLETPQIVENYLQVEGMHGSLDCCEAANGSPVYKTRKLTATFETSRGSILERQDRIDRLIRLAHGRRLPIIHPDYPGRQLMGRIQIQKDFNNLVYGQVSLTAVCDPWFYDMHDEFKELPILDRRHNQISYEKISIMEDLSTAVAGVTGDTDVTTVSLCTTSGTAHTLAVFRISAEADCRYYLSCRLIEKGYWRVSDTTVEPESFSPFVTANKDGYFYIFLHRLQSSGVVNLRDVLCLKVEDITVISAGDAPSEVSLMRESDAITIVSVSGRSYVHSKSTTPDFLLPAGDTPLVVFRRDTSENPGTEIIQWRRRWF